MLMDAEGYGYDDEIEDEEVSDEEITDGDDLGWSPFKALKKAAVYGIPGYGQYRMAKDAKPLAKKAMRSPLKYAVPGVGTALLSRKILGAGMRKTGVGPKKGFFARLFGR